MHGCRPPSSPAAGRPVNILLPVCGAEDLFRVSGALWGAHAVPADQLQVAQRAGWASKGWLGRRELAGAAARAGWRSKGWLRMVCVTGQWQPVGGPVHRCMELSRRPWPGCLYSTVSSQAATPAVCLLLHGSTPYPCCTLPYSVGPPLPSAPLAPPCCTAFRGALQTSAWCLPAPPAPATLSLCGSSAAQQRRPRRWQARCSACGSRRGCPSAPWPRSTAACACKGRRRMRP